MRKKKLGLLWATNGLVLVIGILGIFTFDGDPFTWSMYAVVALVVIVASIITARQKIPSDAHPNQHNPFLWDLAPYTCIHGVNPSSNTTQCAWPEGHDLLKWPKAPTDQERKEKVMK